MKSAVLRGCKKGLEKVKLSLLQINLLGYSLKQAKENVDNLLNGQHVFIYHDESLILDKFKEEAKKIGVVFSLPLKITNCKCAFIV